MLPVKGRQPSLSLVPNIPQEAIEQTTPHHCICTIENKKQDPAKWPNEGVFPSGAQVARKGFAEEETKAQK